MKFFLFLFLIFFSLLSCNSNYDSKTAQKKDIKYQNNSPSQLQGVDDYGMKRYIMAFLKKGPERGHDSATAAGIQRAHLDNIKKLAEEGKLILAGPFLDDGNIRGIYIFNVETVEEAQKLTETDPAVKAGRLTMELHPWYGSGALLEINNLHKKLVRKDI